MAYVIDGQKGRALRSLIRARPATPWPLSGNTFQGNRTFTQPPLYSNCLTISVTQKLYVNLSVHAKLMVYPYNNVQNNLKDYVQIYSIN